jgi:hypothetical protein
MSAALIFGLPGLVSRRQRYAGPEKRSKSEKSLPDLDDLLTAVHPLETLAHLVGVALKRPIRCSKLVRTVGFAEPKSQFKGSVHAWGEPLRAWGEDWRGTIGSIV